MAEKKIAFKITQTGAEQVQNKFGSIDREIQSLIGRYISLGSAIYALKKSFDFTISAAIKEEEGIRKLSTSLKLLGVEYSAIQNEIEGLIARMQAQTEYGDSEMRAALTVMIQLTGDYRKATENLNLVLDIASSGLFGVEEAARYVAMALEGNVQMLGRYIPALRAENNEIIKNGSAAEKAAEAMRILNEKFGGTAQENLESTSAQLKQLNNYLNDIGENIGSFVLPALNKLILSLSQTLGISQLKEAKTALDIYGGAMKRLDAITDNFYKKTGLSQEQMKKFNDKIFETQIAIAQLESDYKKGIISLDQFRRHTDSYISILIKQTGVSDVVSQKVKKQTENTQQLSQTIKELVGLQREMGEVAIASGEAIDSTFDIPTLENILLAQEYMQRLSGSMAQAIIYGQNMKESVVSAIKAIAAELMARATTFAMLSLIMNALGFPAGSAAGVLTGGKSTSFLGYIFGGSFQSGGEVKPNRIHLVGESGPELFIPKTQGQIVPNKKIGQKVENHFHFYGDFIGDEYFLRNKLIPEIERIQELSNA